MKQEIRNNITVLIADENKVFKKGNFIFGDTIYLGYLYYGDEGELLDTPILATPEMFEEIDKPEEPEIPEEITNGGNE